jgi:hypothetical protein
VELVLDHSDTRLPGIMRQLEAAGAELSQVRVRGVDLEDLYHEFSH